MADANNTEKTCPTLEELRKEPPTISIETAAKYLGVSRAYGYSMVKTGHLPVIWLGNRMRRVPTAKLLKMLEGETAQAEGGAA